MPSTPVRTDVATTVQRVDVPAKVERVDVPTTIDRVDVPATTVRRVAVHSTPAQRIGMLFTFVEACAFGFVAALHLGLKVTIGGATFSAPFLYAAAIVEGLLALALLVAVILPGDSGVRAGRVLAAQILAVIGIFVNQIALLRGALLGLAREEIFYGVALVLALASLALVASPVMRRGAIIRESEIRPTHRNV